MGKRVQGIVPIGSPGGVPATDVRRDGSDGGGVGVEEVACETARDDGTVVATYPRGFDADHLSRCWALLHHLFCEITEVVPGAVLGLDRKSVAGSPWLAMWEGEALGDFGRSLPDCAAVTLVAMVRDMHLSGSEIPIASMAVRGSLFLDVFDADEDAVTFRLASAEDVARFCDARNCVPADRDEVLAGQCELLL